MVDFSVAGDEPATGLAEAFGAYARAQARRVLTQMDRDPDSPTIGCFDRNYWHYKIRDFPSSILQQGVFLLEAVRRGDLAAELDAATAARWALAAVNALSRQVRRSGAVDEYFPFESSYPSAAFGLYAACRLLKDWRDEGSDLLQDVEWDGLRRLAAHLDRRQELKACNQYMAGIAGLALAAELPQMRVPADAARRHADRLLASQHGEGWFNEYGGPDFGYLTVTLDALVDYHEVTGDERALDAIDRAVGFLAQMIGADGRLPSTLNARNTDYVVPYGLVRTAGRSGVAAWLVHTLFSHLDAPHHDIWSTDDRYHLHYIYASIVRSLPHLAAMTRPQVPRLERRLWLPGCGYWVIRDHLDDVTVFVGAKKGGLVRLHYGDGRPAEADHGWRVRAGSKLWTTNWWGEHWSICQHRDRLRVQGATRACAFHIGSPIRHMALRGLAFVLRERLAPLLKQLLIFRDGAGTGPRFRREIALTPAGVGIADAFDPTPDAVATPGPRQNFRHVASAESFHPEDGRNSILGLTRLTLRDGSRHRVECGRDQMIEASITPPKKQAALL